MARNSAKTKDSNINAKGELCVGNRRDLSLSGLPARLSALENKVAKMGEEMAKMGEEVTKLGEEFALNRANLTELDDQVLALKLLETEYRQARIQSIVTFKRDKLDTSDDDLDGEIILEGYMGAEEANAIADATLYVSKERSDVHVFEELYGLEPMQVLRIKYKPAISALNLYADVISSKHKVGSEKFYELFAEFIKLLKASESGESYLDDEEPGSLAHAYESFILCAEDEVSDRVS